MFSVCVRDHIMIAHSLRGEVFGPAQRLHGATYVVDVELKRPELDADGVVVDIGLTAQALREVLAGLNYRNLDEVPELSGRNTTTELLESFNGKLRDELLAREIFDRLARRIRAGELGEGALGLSGMRVTLHESHVAWAAYEAGLGP